MGVSGSTFNPSTASTGSNTITYTYTDGNGCTVSATQNVIVNAATATSISGLAASYCSNDGSVTMTGTPSGGTFSGNGVSGTTFNPSTASTGNNTVTYTFTNANGCTSSTTQNVVVNTPPTVSISGLAATYCSNDGSVTITGTPSGGTFSGNGVSGTTFNPSTASTGNNIVTYTYTDGNGCTSSTTQNVTVNAATSVSITGLAASYCSNDGSVAMTGTPSGGTFSGNGVSGTTFDPAMASSGNNIITYTYTNGSGCTTSTTQNVTVNAVPTVSINGLLATYCVSSSSVAMTGTPSGGTFSGNGVSGTTFDPASAGIGNHTVTYTFTTSDGCTETSTQSVDIIAQPVASISGINASYCISAAAVMVTGNPAGGVFSGSGMSGNTFDPAIAGVGQHTIIYDFNAGSGCVDSDTFTVTVNGNPTASFTGLAASYCTSDPIASLSGTPTGGTFSGTGISGTDFKPFSCWYRYF